MKHLLVCAALMTLAAGAPAAAAGVTGIGAEMDVAQCVVDNDPRDVRKLLDTAPGSLEERRVAGPLVDLYGACNNNTPVTGTLAWRERAAIAAAAAGARAGRGYGDLAAAVQQPGWTLTQVADTTAGGGNDASWVGLRRFGDCVVRLAPAAARELVLSESDSAEESAAISALAPTLGQCLAPSQQFRLVRGDLRLVVGEPLYHLLARSG